MKLLVLVLVAICACTIEGYSGTDGFTCTRQDFADFQVKYNKVYASAEEEQQRFEIFCQNALIAHQTNMKVERGSNVQFGITKFTDLTKEEFSKFLGYKKDNNLNYEGIPDGAKRLKNDIAAPTTFDWRSHSPSVVTPVYNQAQCGSCWAFSVTENIESQWALAGHPLTRLSMQQIVSCDGRDGGCNGGDTPTAYQYVISAGGLDSYTSYPYTARDGICRFSSSNVVAKIKSWEYAGRRNETAMVNYLYQYGPLSICVDASSWSSYQSGILPASRCGTQLDHCVQAVGYNLVQKYWIVRNSWASDWGINGYIYLSYGQDTCGIAIEPTTAIV